jgi:hypothetical protein
MEKASLRIRDGEIADRGSARPAGRRILWGFVTEPLGPGKLLARPRGTEFEYAYSEARLKTATRKD